VTFALQTFLDVSISRKIKVSVIEVILDRVTISNLDRFVDIYFCFGSILAILSRSTDGYLSGMQATCTRHWRDAAVGTMTSAK